MYLKKKNTKNFQVRVIKYLELIQTMASLNEKTGVLGRRLAAHLLRRTSYQYTKERIENFATKTIEDAVNELLTVTAPVVDQPIDYANGQTWINPMSDSPSADPFKKLYVSGWWTNEALNSPSILHKVMFFLHSNFVINNDFGRSEELYDYLALLRHYATGNFKELAVKITLNPLMLKYLDGTYNIRSNPNENYAREFFELFTIGKGEQISEGNYTNYTEEDVQAAAKVLTGFKAPSIVERENYLDAETNIPTGYGFYTHHNSADKTFSSAFQGTTISGAVDEDDMMRELQDFVDMVFAQDETARFICRKIYRFFVSGKIDAEIEQDIIEPLAAIFRNNNYELMPVLTALLKSSHFYDEDDSSNTDEIIGGLFKTPLDLVLNIMSYFKLEVPDPLTEPEMHYLHFYGMGLQINFLSKSGLPLFIPDSVAGYPAYYQQPNWHREWFTSSSVIPRYEVPGMLVRGISSANTSDPAVKLNLTNYIKENVSDPYNSFNIVSELTQDLFCEQILPERFGYFLLEIFLDDIDFNDWTLEWARFESTTDDTEVKIALDRFIKHMLFSPEFQLM